jgi:hypothetical protein
MGLPWGSGAVQFTVADADPAVADTAVGASGGPAGVTWVEFAELGPVPMALVALTENWYAVPLLSPETLAVVWEPLTVVGGRADELSPVV